MWLTRYRMYREISRFFAEEPRFGKVLAVSGAGTLFPMFDTSRCALTETRYPEWDLMSLPSADGEYDYILSDQVLEHVADPFKAAEESRRVLRPGGYAIHTTCFMDRIHPNPSDYWRFSCEALKVLHRNYSEVVQCGSWGNRWVYILSSLSRRFRFLPVPESGWSPVRSLALLDDPNFPVVTWIIARK